MQYLYVKYAFVDWKIHAQLIWHAFSCCSNCLIFIGNFLATLTKPRVTVFCFMDHLHCIGMHGQVGYLLLRKSAIMDILWGAMCTPSFLLPLSQTHKHTYIRTQSQKAHQYLQGKRINWHIGSTNRPKKKFQNTRRSFDSNVATITLKENGWLWHSTKNLYNLS